MHPNTPVRVMPPAAAAVAAPCNRKQSFLFRVHLTRDILFEVIHMWGVGGA